MRKRITKKICWAIHYDYGTKLNWKPETILRMEKFRRKHNRKVIKELNKIIQCDPIFRD